MRFFVVQTLDDCEWYDGSIVQMDPKHLTKYLDYLAGKVEIKPFPKRKLAPKYHSRVQHYPRQPISGFYVFDGETMRYVDGISAAA